MRRLLRLGILLTAVALVAAACGDSGRKPVAVLASASTRTIQAKSSRVALTVDVRDGSKPTAASQKITGTGAFDYAGRRGTLTMQTAGLGVPGVSGDIQMVMLGDTFYMHLPTGLLPGKPWLKIDLETLGNVAGVDLAGLQELGSNDPSANLRFLDGADDAKKVGEEKVRGVDTTHYTFVVDLEKAKVSAPAELRDDIDRLIEQIGGSTYPAEAWVDGDDLVRRLRLDLEAIGGKDAPKGSAVVTQEFFDFGVQVDAVAPAPDQTSDFAQLLQGAGLGR